MSTEHRTFQFAGALAADQTSGYHRTDYNRVVTRVEINARGIAPATACTFYLRVDSANHVESITLAAGLTYAEVNLAGDGLTVAADSFLDAVVVSAGGAADIDLVLTITAAADLGITSTEDLGLGTLLDLKTQIITAGQLTATDYDATIAAIGRGVAAAFDAHCRRIFKRGSAVTETFDADRDFISLSRYPVETITTIALQTDPDTGFVTQTGVIRNRNDAAGIIHLSGPLGSFEDQIRVTYTGGFWYDTTVDGTGSLPSGATLLPYDIKLAWLLQSEHLWDKHDKLGISHTEPPDQRSTLTNVRLIPQVLDILNNYRRLLLS